jgi:hypothetical protein
MNFDVRDFNYNAALISFFSGSSTKAAEAKGIVYQSPQISLGW